MEINNGMGWLMKNTPEQVANGWFAALKSGSPISFEDYAQANKYTRMFIPNTLEDEDRKWNPTQT